MLCDYFCWFWARLPSCVHSATMWSLLPKSAVCDLCRTTTSPRILLVNEGKIRKHSKLLICILSPFHVSRCCFFAPFRLALQLPQSMPLSSTASFRKRKNNSSWFTVICNSTIHMQMKLALAKIIIVAHGRINNWSLPRLCRGLI